MNRLFDFKVKHPNLNTISPDQQLGKRRYRINKNINSIEFNLKPEPPPNLPIAPTLSSLQDPYTRLKELLQQKDKELKALQQVTQNFSHLVDVRRRYVSPEPRLEIRERLLPEHVKSNSFSGKQPEYYSKTRPKVFVNNPILGYPSRSISPDKRLANIGNFVFAS